MSITNFLKNFKNKIRVKRNAITQKVLKINETQEKKPVSKGARAAFVKGFLTTFIFGLGLIAIRPRSSAQDFNFTELTGDINELKGNLTSAPVPLPVPIRIGSPSIWEAIILYLGGAVSVGSWMAGGLCGCGVIFVIFYFKNKKRKQI